MGATYAINRKSFLKGQYRDFFVPFFTIHLHILPKFGGFEFLFHLLGYSNFSINPLGLKKQGIKVSV